MTRNTNMLASKLNPRSWAARGLTLAAALVLALVASACGSEGSGSAPGSNPENVGEIDLDLAAVPSGVLCINATLGSVTRAVTVAANQTSVNLQQLPLGNITVNAQAFNVACSALSGATATWVADQQTVLVQAGTLQPLKLVFRQYLPTQASANFLPTVKKIATSYGDTAMLLANGDVALWGGYDNNLPVKRLGFTNAIDVGLGQAFGCALKSDGTIWCWGNGASGQLGAGTTVSSATTPVKVASSAVFATLSVGYDHACATTAYSAAAANAGTYAVYCWGYNGDGELGDGTLVSRWVPTSISPFGVTIAAGQWHTCAITAAGKVRCWGYNHQYQFGNGTTTNQPDASQAPQATGLSNVVQLVAGNRHTIALDATGNAYCWGENYDGACGLGNTTAMIGTPTQMYGGYNVLAVTSGNCMIKANNALYCFGYNSDGQVGNNSVLSQPVPVNIFGSGIVSSAQGVSSSHTCAINTAGQPFCWGRNDLGQVMGRADSDQYVPYQLSNW